MISCLSISLVISFQIPVRIIIIAIIPMTEYFELLLLLEPPLLFPEVPELLLHLPAAFCFTSPPTTPARILLPDSRPVLSYFSGHSRFHQNRSSLPLESLSVWIHAHLPFGIQASSNWYHIPFASDFHVPAIRQMALPCRIPRRRPQSSFQSFSSFVCLPVIPSPVFAPL